MSGVRIKIGGPIFREIREDSCYYADKTGFLEEFLGTVPHKISVITRPRRFGKTLMMNTLYDFFDITQDSKAIFEGLAISKNKELCDKWMNQYPAVLISLKEMEGDNFCEAMAEYSHILERLCGDLSYLQESPLVGQQEKDILACLGKVSKEKDVLLSSLETLCHALHAHWGRPVILLIDEYDVPLARAQEYGYYREMEEFLRTMLNKTVQGNTSLQFAILTGCLRISKESIFTDIDNVQFFDVAEPSGADKIGFTPKEVDDLLAAVGVSAGKEKIKEWYEGYRFGEDTTIYCPWDILLYTNALRANPNAKPKLYWGDTSGNDVVSSFIERADSVGVQKIEKLLAGRYVTSCISKTLTHDTLYASEASLWTHLYQTGYLTRADPSTVESSDVSPDVGHDAEVLPLVIPNKEIRAIFIKTIKSRFDASMWAMNRKPLFDAFWNGDSEAFQDIFSDILLKAIYYDNYYETFYQAVLTGLFFRAGWEITDESGPGRLAIFVNDYDNARAAIIEVRHSAALEEMPRDAENALCQIDKKRYVSSLEGHYKKIMFWGISFWKKFCVAKAEPATCQV